MPAPLLAALLCLAPPAAGEPGPPGESGLPVVRTVETPGVPTPPQTLRVEDRGGWVVVTLTVDPPAADEEEADPPAAGDEEEDDAGGGAFGDSGGEGEDADDADDETVPADRPAAGPEWAVVLCEVDPAVTPAVVAGGEEAPGSVAVRYGPYFVRDDAGQLRVLRQPKPAPAAGGANETPAWALTDLPADPTWSGYGGGGAIRLAAVKQGGWFWTLSQPDAGLRETLGGGDGDGEEPDATTLPADVLVRVAPAASGGYGSSAYGRGLTEFSVSGDGDGGGDATVRDEGDLLTADRTPSWMPAFMEAFERRAAAREAARADLAGKPAPMLDAVYLTSAGERRGWDAAPVWLAGMKGRVVLLDFWATWCGPCIAKLPKVNALHEKYADRGLKVVGVHLPDGVEEVPDFLEDHEVAFPLAVATEAAADAYGLAFVPTYVLIGRDGRVIGEPGPSVPSAARIEAALAAGADSDGEPAADEPADEEEPAND